jgi:hypothetical protein
MSVPTLYCFASRIFEHSNLTFELGHDMFPSQPLHVQSQCMKRIKRSQGCEEWCLLGCYAVWLLYEQTFRRNLAPSSSG